ncbi:MAG: YrbL family protein [Desulfococcaceae bacterium]|nr:YrbL family protein [Desulfococcaceae bacterium]
MDKSLLFGKGLHRECYVHPRDEHKCIKIVVSGGMRETEREEAYYKRLAKRNISWAMLPRFYGTVRTDRGRGAVFELIRDDDGNISETLKYYLQNRKKEQPVPENLANMLHSSKAYLIREKIVTMTLKAKNIVIQRKADNKDKLVIIDNIGHDDFIPICDYMDFPAVRKIHRRWNRFEKSLQETYGYSF